MIGGDGRRGGNGGGLNTYKPTSFPTGRPGTQPLSLQSTFFQGAALTRLFRGGDVLLIIKAVAGGAARLNFL